MTDANPTDLFSGTKEVAESHRFDEAKLAAWLEANVEGYRGPLTVRQFKGGQSNPTYQLITPAKKYVMRRKPPGKLLPSAHAVDREYRVIAALYPLGFPVAMFTAIFAMARTVGWYAQWNEMIADPDQKIARPRQLYTGQTKRDLVPMGKRK